VRVVYIGGYTRSGSTLLDRILGSSPGAVAVGELRHIWSMGFIENRFCSCGAPFADCSFWAEVTATAFPGLSPAEVERLNRQEEWLLKARHTRALLHPANLRGRLRQARDEFVATRGRLCRAIAETAGASVIVDSSKNPSYGLLLSTMPALEVGTIHLIRDSRATSFSWLRLKSDPRHAGRADYFPRRAAHVSSAWWAANALLMEFISRAGPRRHLRVRYEDLVANPQRELTRVRTHAGLPFEQNAPGGATFVLPEHHSIGGNPVRFQHGEVAVREDTEWRTAMRRRDRAIVTAITWPLLLRYGYLARPLPGQRR
jgi:hypothetical protein